ncbi:hypothetical protein U1Q18_014685, partial [Sarracenia purpurea var. burkii]
RGRGQGQIRSRGQVDDHVMKEEEAHVQPNPIQGVDVLQGMLMTMQTLADAAKGRD